MAYSHPLTTFIFNKLWCGGHFESYLSRPAQKTPREVVLC
jgi:hypothetical protein